ncbi:aminotransferase class I/II-fold pyridoxal phosphate-dependent enzyme [Rhodopseudomonas sp. B29]|uniref:aminotransferase class I/II-fold pyridoxal phosphate-dependent enzyme n=1 Tax=Rhodopseudomonas sp. B29 TaxID=95607 RepID=UPI000348D75E|nr:aminotransferase class I/II-fold pyridoxal phosphate-dependent enzyme [Rhodopseudomonas sp. B29]
MAAKSQIEWCPSLAASEAPRYLAFVQALENDISSGALKPGTRLLPQRDMAVRLGFSLGTISKAYAEAEARGLISGEVGRGTFVQRRQSSGAGSNQTPASMNLALNVPPPTGEAEVIAQVLEDIVSDGALQPLLGYLPHQGLPQHRAAMARWFAELGIKTDVDQLFITNGGQHGLSIALGMTASAKDFVLTERFSIRA